MCAQPLPLVVKSFVNSFPLLVPLKVTAPAYITDKTKSPATVVVTTGPATLLETTSPLAMLDASGTEVETPDTSHSVISTWVGEPTNVGVMAVAPDAESTAYQISVAKLLTLALAPPET